jgi:hypothetical protein
MEDRIGGVTDEDRVDQFLELVDAARRQPGFRLRDSLIRYTRSVRIDERRQTAIAAAVVHERLRHGSRPL